MAEDSLLSQQQAERLRALAQTLEWSHDAIIGATLDGVITSWNRGARNIYGYHDDEIIGKRATTLVPPERAEEFKSVLQELRRGRTLENYETVRVTKTGQQVDLSITASPVRDAQGQVTAITAICRDITAQKRAELALQNSEGQYRLLFEGNPLAMWVYEHSSLRFLAVNEAAVQQYGYSRAEFLRMTLRDIRPPGDIPAFLQAISDRSPGLWKYGVWRHRRRDGTLFHVEITSHSLLFNGTEADLVMAQDVTERIRSEQQLRQSEARFSKAFRSSPLAISISTQDGRYLDVNDNFLQLVGRTKEEVLGHTVSELGIWAEPSDRHAVVDALNSHEKVARTRTQFRTKSGELRQVRTSAELIDLDDQLCMLAITEDVTEAERLEQQFRQAQRMEAIGRLAGGVAHDFNNILGVILGYSELLEERLAVDKVAVEQFHGIKQAAQRAVDLTRQLLAFSRQQHLQPRPLNLNEVIDGLSSMLRRIIGEDVQLVLSLHSDLRTVHGDPSQIVQIVMNLVVNSRDAMPHGGKLTIITTNVDLDGNYVKAHPGAREGSYVELSVSDTGTGIAPEILPHIFEPFFSTKLPGQGTGLGLSTVYGIVKQSGGYIWAESDGSTGSSFNIYLPMVDAPPLQWQPAPAKDIARGGSETILLVEDDDMFRKLVREILENAGYKVIEAEGPTTAVHLAAKETPADIRLLLADLVMPEGTGADLARKLRAKRPNLKVVIMSGHSGDIVAGYTEILAANTVFIQKPFTPVSLLSTIRSVLDTQGETTKTERP